MTEKDFLKYVEALCKHPRMYTTTGSFNEVTMFLEGYGAANVDELYYHSVFTPFLKWVINKFAIPEKIVNWNVFRKLFPDDSEALKNLPILYKEYVESSAA